MKPKHTCSNSGDKYPKEFRAVVFAWREVHMILMTETCEILKNT